MARTLPTAWVQGSNYAPETNVLYRSIIFTANNQINNSQTNPLEDDENWRVGGVHRIDDIYSLAESTKIAVNRQIPQIENSLFLYIQLMEQSIATRLRVPNQIRRTEISVIQTDPNNGESYIDLPDATLQIDNIRIVNPSIGGDDGDFNSLIYNGRYEINEANYYEYQLIRQRYDSDIDFFDAVSSTQFRSMVYWNDGQRAYFAPGIDAGTTIEVVYYAELTPLGHPILLTNAMGIPVNAANQTEAEFLAANPGGTFVQASGIQETNWFVQAGPRMCLYGTIMQMEEFLKDDERWPLFQQKFLAAEDEIRELIAKFEQKRSSAQYFKSHYPT